MLIQKKEQTLIDQNGPYAEKDNILSEKLDAVIEKWNTIYQAQETEQKNKNDIEAISYSFRTAEFEIIDLIAQIDGYEARIKTLDKLEARLNNLPQLPHILKSEIDVFTSRMQTTTRTLAQLERDSIRPQLESLVQLRVILPIEKDHFRKKLEMLIDLTNDMEKLFKIAIQQRACQQLVSYTYDRNQWDITYKLHALKDAKSNLENELELFIKNHSHVPSPPRNTEKRTENTDDDIHIAMIKNLLNEFFKNHYKHNPDTHKSVVEQFRALQHLEITLKKKWQDDFQACLEAAQEL